MNEFATTRVIPAPAAVAERVTGLTAWDAQRLKHMAAELPEGRLFLILLRFTGGRRS